MTIQERIRLVRTRNKLTQEQFAASIGLKRNNYAQMESGRQEPGLGELVKIVRKYNIRYEWLIEGKGPIENLTPVDSVVGVRSRGKVRGKVDPENEVEKYTLDLTPELQIAEDKQAKYQLEAEALRQEVERLKIENEALMKAFRALGRPDKSQSGNVG